MTTTAVHAVLTGVLLLLCAEARGSRPLRTQGFSYPSVASWPGCVVPYVTDGTGSEALEAQKLEWLQEAIQMWHYKVPGLQIRPKQPEDTHYIDIRSRARGGGYSDLGRGAPTRMRLGPVGTCDVWCYAHEFGHALGLGHEFLRADRDSYLDVEDENKPSTSPYYAHDLGPFDYQSVMQYSPGEGVGGDGKLRYMRSPYRFLRQMVTERDVAAVLFLHNHCKPPETAPRCMVSVDRRTLVGIGREYRLTFVGMSAGEMTASVTHAVGTGGQPAGGVAVTESANGGSDGYRRYGVVVQYTAEEAARGQDVVFRATFAAKGNAKEQVACEATLAVDPSGVVCWGKGGDDPTVCGGLTRGVCTTTGRCKCHAAYKGIECGECVTEGQCRRFERIECSVSHASRFEGPGMGNGWTGGSARVEDGVLSVSPSGWARWAFARAGTGWRVTMRVRLGSLVDGEGKVMLKRGGEVCAEVQYISKDWWKGWSEWGGSPLRSVPSPRAGEWVNLEFVQHIDGMDVYVDGRLGDTTNCFGHVDALEVAAAPTGTGVAVDDIVVACYAQSGVRWGEAVGVGRFGKGGEMLHVDLRTPEGGYVWREGIAAQVVEAIAKGGDAAWGSAVRAGGLTTSLVRVDPSDRRKLVVGPFAPMAGLRGTQQVVVTGLDRLVSGGGEGWKGAEVRFRVTDTCSGKGEGEGCDDGNPLTEGDVCSAEGDCISGAKRRCPQTCAGATCNAPWHTNQGRSCTFLVEKWKCDCGGCNCADGYQERNCAPLPPIAGFDVSRCASVAAGETCIVTCEGGWGHGAVLYRCPKGNSRPETALEPVDALPTCSAPTSIPSSIRKKILSLTGGVFDASLATTGVENPGDPSARAYSVIGQLNKRDYLHSGGGFMFELRYTYADGTKDVLVWKQTSWLTEDVITGFEPLSLPDLKTFLAFKGLGRSSNGETYLDGNGAERFWWNAVGIMVQYKGGIPAYNLKVAVAQELYVLSP